MKTIFTQLRHGFFVLFLTLSFTNAFSQSVDPSISNLTAKVENNQLLINWNIEGIDASNYCQVQASKDGITYTTIGMVMGADPKNPTGFKFKQSLDKLKPGQVFYRVLNMENSGLYYVSHAVKTTK